MEKGNRVKIIGTGNIWEGKSGTVLSESDGVIKVQVNLDINGTTKNVIETFLEENLEMEKEAEILTESKQFFTIEYYDLDGNFQEEEKCDSKEEAIEIGKRKVAESKDAAFRRYPGSDPDFNSFIVKDSEGNVVYPDEEENESLKESLLKEAKEKPEDIIHKYIYLQDLDDKEIPAWNFAARIATAEDMEEGCVQELAEKLGYKIFFIEAPGFFRSIIAAKEIKAEDIMEEYGDFLQGKAFVREIK